jgi:hypothetical protein
MVSAAADSKGVLVHAHGAKTYALRSKARRRPTGWRALVGPQPQQCPGDDRHGAGYLSGPFDGGMVLLPHAGGNAPALADHDALGLRPGPDIGAALTACRGTRRPVGWSLPCCAGGFNERVSSLRNAAAFFLLRSISYSAPPKPNRTVSSAGPPSRSSSSATVTLCAISPPPQWRFDLHRTQPVSPPPAATPQITPRIQGRLPAQQARRARRLGPSRPHRRVQAALPGISASTIRHSATASCFLMHRRDPGPSRWGP